MQYTIWLTYACNLKCAYCYEEEEKRNLYLNKERAKQLLGFIKNRSDTYSNDNVSIVLHGGEPLLNYEVLHYIVENLKAWNKNVSISMTTNGTLINEDNIEFIINNIDDLSISIDGTPNDHDSNRKYRNGKGSFIDTVAYIDKILERKSDTIARMTVTPVTVKNLYDNVKFLYDTGFKLVSPIINQYDNNWNEDTMAILEDQLLQLSNFCNSQAEELHIGMLEKMKNRKKSQCCPETTLNIDAKGDIYPCVYVVGDERFLIGNIIDGISNDKLLEIKHINNKEFKQCKGCFWKDYCHGYRCKLFNFAISGKYEPEYAACRLEHALLKTYKQCTFCEKSSIPQQDIGIIS